MHGASLDKEEKHTNLTEQRQIFEKMRVKCKNRHFLLTFEILFELCVHAFLSNRFASMFYDESSSLMVNAFKHTPKQSIVGHVL